jgi:phage/plasmid-like protein (TIGR03299 family)
MVRIPQSMEVLANAPWAKAGKNVADYTNVIDAICDAGMDYTVQTEQAGVMFGGQFQRAEDRFHIVRQDTRETLGVCKKVWKPLQNIDAFSFFQDWMDAGLCQLEAIGQLNRGAKLWILARITGDDIEIVPGDVIRRYVLLVNGHDGLTSVKCGFTPIRVTCSNMFPAVARDEATALIRFRHSRLVVSNLEKVKNVMDLANQEFVATAEQYSELASREFNTDDVQKYVRQCLNVDVEGELKTRSQNIVDDIMARVYGGRGQDNPNVQGTWWAAVNGVNEYFNHAAGRADESRLNSLWFGQNQNRNATALKLAYKYAGVAVAA